MTSRPPMTSHRLAEMLLDRRDNDIVFHLPAIRGSFLRITGVAYATLADTLVILTDEEEVCDAGLCYENPATPGRCPHGRSPRNGRTEDPSARLYHLAAPDPVRYDDWGDSLPADLTGLHAATGSLLIAALRHLKAARTERPGAAPNTCCPRCCHQCRALAWYMDRASLPADTATRTLVDLGEAPDLDWQLEDGLIRWVNVMAAWADADRLGCHSEEA